ncbi:MAG: DUF6273 domain-containing protein, partial [Firmicutes bacterium]|nr:DUF6273 domain-containing protein [Bacillota bacterium]
MVQKTRRKFKISALFTLFAALVLFSAAAGFLGSRPSAPQSARAAMATELDVGDYIEGFGDLKWRVVGKDENGLLLRTDRAALSLFFSMGNAGFVNSAVSVSGSNQLARASYGTNYWQQAQIREYLNQPFYTRFSDAEKMIIGQVPQKQILWWGDATAVHPDYPETFSIAGHTPAPGLSGSVVFGGSGGPLETALQNYDDDVFSYTISDRIFLPDIKQMYESSTESENGRDLRNANGDSYHIVLDEGGSAVNAWTRTPYASHPIDGIRVQSVSSDGSILNEAAFSFSAVTPALYIIPGAAFAVSRASSAASGEQEGYRVYSDISYPVDIAFEVVDETGGTLSAEVAGAPIESGSTVYSGSAVSFTAVPDKFYRVKQWAVNGKPVPGNLSNIFTLHIGADSVVTVEFEYAAHAVAFEVAGGNGEISAEVLDGADAGGIESPQTVAIGDTVVFTAVPDAHYRVKEWRVNGAVVAGHTAPEFTMVIPEVAPEGGVSVEAEFELKEQVAIPESGVEMTYNGLGQLPAFPPSARYTVEAAIEAAVGTYPALAKLNDPERFEWEDGETADVPLEWHILKAVRNNTVTLGSWTYGAHLAPGIGLVPDAAPVTYYYYEADDTEYEFPSMVQPRDVGTYRVRAYIAEADSYLEFWSDAVQFSIAKAVLTVFPFNQSKPSGAPNPELTLGFSGFAYGDDELSAIAGEFLAELHTGDFEGEEEELPAGIYLITVAAGSAEAQNYSFVFLSGSLTVARGLIAKPELVDPSSVIFTYNRAQQGFTGMAFSGFDPNVMQLINSFAIGAGRYVATVIILDTESYGWEGGGTVEFAWEIK